MNGRLYLALFLPLNSSTAVLGKRNSLALEAVPAATERCSAIRTGPLSCQETSTEIPDGGDQQQLDQLQGDEGQ